MPAPWIRMYVEMYGPRGYEGRWDIGPSPSDPVINEAARDRVLEQLRQGNPHYPDHHVECIDAGTDLVFGVFHSGVRPKGLKPPPPDGTPPPPTPQVDPTRPPPIPDYFPRPPRT